MKVKMIGRTGAPNQQLPFTVLKPDRKETDNQKKYDKVLVSCDANVGCQLNLSFEKMSIPW